MKKKSIIVYSIFACIIYVLAIAYFAFNLCYEFSNGVNRTRRRFDHTSAAIQESITKINSENYDANKIKNLIFTSFGNMNDFAYIDLFENGKKIYSYKTNTISEGSTSKLLKNYTSTFRINNKEYFLTANLYTLRPSSIFVYGKRAFLVILIVTIITFILIVVSNLNSLKNEQCENEDDEAIDYNEVYNSQPVISTTQDELKAENQSTASENDINAENIDVESVEETETENESIEASQENFEEADDEETEPVLDNSSEEVNADLPEGMYSPETGLSFEPFLETKLNNEINRSIASESDLSLFIIQIPDVEKDNALFKQICNYLFIQFQYKELVFEYKSNSIAAIKVNSTIDESITFADKIHADIKNIINNDEINFYIGITSRTIRMVNAERLLIEADEALEHAKEDKNCPIIAFRADAEKFRLANL